jgi:hypothetical protein
MRRLTDHRRGHYLWWRGSGNIFSELLGIWTVIRLNVRHINEGVLTIGSTEPGIDDFLKLFSIM